MEKPALLGNYPDLGEKVYEAVRDQIVTCELAPAVPFPSWISLASLASASPP